MSQKPLRKKSEKNLQDLGMKNSHTEHRKQGQGAGEVRWHMEVLLQKAYTRDLGICRS